MSTQYVLDDSASQDGFVDVYRVNVDESDAAHMGAVQRHWKTCLDNRRIATFTPGEGTNMEVHWNSPVSREDVEQVKRKLWLYAQRSFYYSGIIPSE